MDFRLVAVRPGGDQAGKFLVLSDGTVLVGFFKRHAILLQKYYEKEGMEWKDPELSCGIFLPCSPAYPHPCFIKVKP